MTKPLQWATTRNTVAHAIDAIRSAKVASFDLETTGLNAYAADAAVSLAQFTIRDPDLTTFVVPLFHPDSSWRGKWRTVLTHLMLALDGVPLIGHNVKFDAVWIHATTGVDVSHQIAWDTMVAARMLDENSGAKLEDLCVRLLGAPSWGKTEIHALMNRPGGSLNVPLIDLGVYGRNDTEWTYRLWEYQRRIMVPTEMPQSEDEWLEYGLGVLMRKVSMPAIRALAQVEQRGMALDLAEVRKKHAEAAETARQGIESLGAAFPDVPGEPSTASASKWFTEASEQAVERGDLQVISTTPKGRPQWNYAALSRNARRAPGGVADLVLSTREAEKQAQFLSAWGEAQRDSVIHSTFNVGTARTGRLSSSGPNLQQVSRKLKHLFVPREGFVLGEFDYSQVEARVAAHISRCEPLIEAYREGIDIHSVNASLASGIPVEQIDKDQRQRGKAVTFGLIFGMQPAGFVDYAETSYGVTFTLDEAEAVREEFFRHWTGLKKWHEDCVEHARTFGYVVSPLGRVRRVPEIHSQIGKDRAHAQNQAINAPVQGMASDLMMLAMSSIAGTTVFGPDCPPGVDGAHVVATVHDSIEVEMDESRWESVAAEVIERMENPDLSAWGMKDGLLVPLVADAAVGLHWGSEELR